MTFVVVVVVVVVVVNILTTRMTMMTTQRYSPGYSTSQNKGVVTENVLRQKYKFCTFNKAVDLSTKAAFFCS